MLSAINILADIGDGHGYNHMWGNGSFGWIWGAFMMIAMVGLAVALIVWLIRGGSQPNYPPPADPTLEAKSILARRLANGEISPEEYHDRLSHLG